MKIRTVYIYLVVVALVIIFGPLLFAAPLPEPDFKSFMAEVPQESAATPEVAMEAMRRAILKNNSRSPEILSAAIRYRKAAILRQVAIDPKGGVVKITTKITCLEVARLLHKAVTMTPEKAAALTDVASAEAPECVGNFKDVIESVPVDEPAPGVSNTPIFAFPPGPPTGPWVPVTPVTDR